MPALKQSGVVCELVKPAKLGWDSGLQLEFKDLGICFEVLFSLMANLPVLVRGRHLQHFCYCYTAHTNLLQQ